MVEVAIIAETGFYRESVAFALQHTAGVHIADTAAVPEELSLNASRDCVLLLDVAHRDNGPDIVFEIRQRHPESRIVVLGITEREADIVAYAEAGAAGYLTPNHSLDELARTIQSAANGEMLCTPRIAAALNRRVRQLHAKLRPAVPDHQLSRRETEIAALLERGLSNQEISRELCIALATVKNHVHNILTKLGLDSRADAAAWVRRHKLNHAAVVRKLPTKNLRPLRTSDSSP